jgi:hypothetical protein
MLSAMILFVEQSQEGKMHERLRNKVAPMLASIVFQAVFIGCSSQSPMAPATELQTSQAIVEGRSVTVEASSSGTGAQNSQSGQESRAATEFNAGFLRDEVSRDIEFTGLIVGFDVEAQTIRLMQMSGSFKTWVGHIDENSELIGIEGEAVTLADC